MAPNNDKAVSVAPQLGDHALGLQFIGFNVDRHGHFTGLGHGAKLFADLRLGKYQRRHGGRRSKQGPVLLDPGDPARDDRRDGALGVGPINHVQKGQQGLGLIYRDVPWLYQDHLAGQVLLVEVLGTSRPNNNQRAGLAPTPGSRGQEQPGRLGLNGRLDNDLGVLSPSLLIPGQIEVFEGE